MFDGEEGAGAGTQTVETTETGDGGGTTPARVEAERTERVEGILAVPAVPEGIRRAAGVDGTTPAEPEPAAVAAGVAAEGELARLRDLVLEAHPDVVPELVVGGSLDELLASVAGARAAYGRVEERVRSVQPESVGAAEKPAVPVVPAGGGTHVADVDSLAPRNRIARALRQQKVQQRR
jgi:hypothetical protein